MHEHYNPLDQYQSINRFTRQSTSAPVPQSPPIPIPVPMRCPGMVTLNNRHARATHAPQFSRVLSTSCSWPLWSGRPARKKPMRECHSEHRHAAERRLPMECRSNQHLSFWANESARESKNPPKQVRRSG